MKTKKKIISTFMMICVFLHILPAVVPTDAVATGMREIKQVAISLSMPPVNAADVSALAVSSKTGGCYIKSAAWYDMYGQLMTNKFTNENATLEIVVVASAGYYFPGDVVVTIGGDPAARENYGSELHISKSYSPVIWAPTMVKHPGDETVEEEGVASFVSYSSCTNKSSWQILDTNKTVYSAEAFAEKFPDLFVDISFEKLNISPVPMELNGYKVRCCFTGPGGDVNSNYAVLTVEEKLEETVAEDMVTATPSPTPAHEHVFSTALSRDAGYHWYACECGEALDKEEHRYIWTQKAVATIDAHGTVCGVCKVCDYCINCSTELDPAEIAEIKAVEAVETTTEPQQLDPLVPVTEEKQSLREKLSSFIQAHFLVNKTKMK